MSIFKKRITDNTPLNSEFPLLNEAGKGNPFQVPENYFEGFEKQVMQQIRFVKPVSPVQSFIRNLSQSLLQPQVAVAASFIIIIATSALLYFNDLGYQIKPVTSSHTNNYETIVVVNENLPEGKMFAANIESQNNDIQIIVELSPEMTPEKVKAITSAFPTEIPVFAQIEQNVHKYFANHTQFEEYINTIGSQTENFKLTEHISKAPSNTSTTYNQIYQYHPQYQSSPVFPLTSTAPQDEQKKPVQIQEKQPQIEKTPAHTPNNYRLPHFALPENVCSETAYELKPYSINKEYNYLWSTGEKTPTITVRSSGTYTLTIYDPENPNVFVTSSSQVSIIPRPPKSLPSHAVLCSGSTLKLEPKIENPELYTYFWIPTYQTVKDITVSEQSLYVLSITGCNTYYDSVLVMKEHCDIMIPNIITPNNDGLNDYFYIQGLDNYPATKLTIYDRNGTLLFSTNDYQNNWGGDNLPNGTYFYIIRFYDGIEKHGTLTILK